MVESERPKLEKAYAAALEHALTCAEHLQFGGCGWGDDECKALAEVLPLFKHAKTLNLSRNAAMSDEGIAALANALLPTKTAPRLREVSIQHVHYGPKAVEALRELSLARDLIWKV